MAAKKTDKKKHSGGRPTKYEPDYCRQLLNFFSGPKSRQVVKAEISGKNDYHKTEYMFVPNELPTFAKFARKIGVNGDTLVEWATAKYPDNHENKTLRGKPKHPEFSAAYNAAKDLQKEFLIDNGLAGLYPPASYIFTSKNVTDMRDKQEIDHTSKGEAIKGFNYIVPNDPDAPTNP